MQETKVLSLGWEDPLEKETATHSSILAWRIPWIEEPGRVHGVTRVRHGLVTKPPRAHAFLIKVRWDLHHRNTWKVKFIVQKQNGCVYRYFFFFFPQQSVNLWDLLRVCWFLVSRVELQNLNAETLTILNRISQHLTKAMKQGAS